jgi:hypothetical protein
MNFYTDDSPGMKLPPVWVALAGSSWDTCAVHTPVAARLGVVLAVTLSLCAGDGDSWFSHLYLDCDNAPCRWQGVCLQPKCCVLQSQQLHASSRG